jgi:hypothetical protein
VVGAAGPGLAKVYLVFTHIAHQFNLLTDNEEAGESDQRNGSDD